ncbi:pseudaminic acid synthase [Chitinophaga agrisoli]|uniref:Pseudaminic acid synthase n=1 Tax=Chitinophaga agrisoli TaxID=2607653 RepID=A0A5B2W387_9BACT|nr:pseudaminic acid synthase [Chitinophaga agrisoli]KAA2245348.1 pseudaminic acid synthase [Chitinophaga agrisoli]
MKEFKIDTQVIGYSHRPFIIAEMSGNHNRSLERAMSIVKAAKDAGADAIKLQTYTPDSMTIDHKGGLFDITDEKSLWKGRNLYELYQEAMTPYEWHKPLFDYAKELGIICFSTPFDEEAVDLLEELGAPCHKIASFENNHHPLLKKIARTGKPVIMSTGVSSLADIDESVITLRNSGCNDLVLLKCTSTYPASPENTNLLTIPHMREMFKCEVGLSDHTMGIGAAVGAVVLGARVVEKHFCLSRAEGGVDSAFSLEPHEFKALVQETERAFLALGEVKYGVQEAEKKSMNFKRSIYVVEDIPEGGTFTEKNLRVIRPGDGLHPRFFDTVIGKRATQALKRGMPFRMDMFH